MDTELEAKMSAAPTLPAVVSVEEAARVLGISRSTAYNAVRDGDLPSVRIRGRILIPAQKLAELLRCEPAETAASP